MIYFQHYLTVKVTSNWNLYEILLKKHITRSVFLQWYLHGVRLGTTHSKYYNWRHKCISEQTHLFIDPSASILGYSAHMYWTQWCRLGCSLRGSYIYRWWVILYGCSRQIEKFSGRVLKSCNNVWMRCYFGGF